MSTPIVEVKNLVKSFSLGKSYVRALRGVTFSLYPGEFLIIYGPSGCGKSTLLNMIAGLDKITSGAIFINGKNLEEFTPREHIEWRRLGIGIVFQNYNLISSISVLENTALPLTFCGVSKKERINRAKEILSTLNLSDKMRRLPSELSGGEQQRVSIARAVVTTPPLILADEPTGNLDEESGWEVMSILSWLCRRYGRTVLLVTHNPVYFSLADRILYMKNGRIVKEDIVPEKMKLAQLPFQASSLSYYVPAKSKKRMRFRDILALAYKHFRYARARTFLTILGISIGIAAIILLVSLGYGLQKITTSRLVGFDNLLKINVSEGAQGPKLDDTQVQKIKQLDNVEAVSPVINFVASGTLLSTTTSVTVTGFMPELADFEQVNLQKGRTFASDSALEAIVSAGALKSFDIRDSTAVLDKKIKLTLLQEDLSQQELEMTVVGIAGGENMPLIFVPLNTVKKFAQDRYSNLNVKVKNREKIKSVAERIEELGFRVSSTSEIVEQVDKVFLIIQILLGTIGGIALFVASFGIVNTMTISLLERTHEVGIMKALGISFSDVKRLFINEAGYFGFFGGIFGIALGYLVGQFFNGVVYVLMKQSGEVETLTPFVTPWKFALAILLFAILLGRLAGYYPAWRAARLSPLEALRHE